ncbi:MAG: GNAT family N-acetyltransferase [Candidatus Latescibacteria bacterium]|nr:GNAT family N-acetyltransferase [Candidatus Latescibacterota bacterium]
MSTWEIRHVNHASPESDKQETLRIWDEKGGLYADLTRQRLQAQFAQERFGMAVAFDKGKCVSTTAYILSPRGQGILTQVYTVPAYRGQGIGKATVAETIQILRALEGRAIYLAAWQDWIRNIYQKAGFEFIGAMGNRHAFKLTLDPSGDDSTLFRKNQQTAIRPLAKDDQADLSALFNAKHNNIIKHYELSCFLGSHFEAEFFKLQKHKGHTACVLDGTETIQGFATIMPSHNRHETHCGTVDLLIHTNQTAQAEALLDALETTSDSEVLYTYIASNENSKRSFFLKAGYQKIAHLKKRLSIGTAHYDLDLYEKQRH